MTISTQDVHDSLARTRKLSGRKALAYAAAAAVMSTTCVASADFSGDFDPSNWSSTFNGGMATNDGSTLVITGPDDGVQAEFEYSVAIQTDGAISFDWEYTNLLGDYGSYDYAGFLVDGAFTLLATNQDAIDNGGTAFGSIDNLELNAGQTFTFAIASADGLFGAGQLTVTNFNVVPEPSALGLLAAGTIGGLLAGRRRKS